MSGSFPSPISLRSYPNCQMKAYRFYFIKVKCLLYLGLIFCVECDVMIIYFYSFFQMSNKSPCIFLNSQSFPHQSTMSDDTFIYVWIYFCSISFHLYFYLYTLYMWYLSISIFGKGNNSIFFFQACSPCF